MKATGKEFTPPRKIPPRPSESCSQLNLHQFSADVEEICDQAMKEEKMEAGLKRYRASGRSRMVHSMYKVPHPDDVPLSR